MDAELETASMKGRSGRGLEGAKRAEGNPLRKSASEIMDAELEWKKENVSSGIKSGKL